MYSGPDADKENNYSNTGKLYAAKDIDGKIYDEDYGEEGMHAVICPAVKAWQDHLYDTARKMAKVGLGRFVSRSTAMWKKFPCCDPNHGHLVHDPETWLSKGHWITYGQRIMKTLRKEFPDFAHTGEDASEPFLHCLDGFMCWRFAMPRHVPLFQSVYSPRIQFVGRCSDVNRFSGS